MFIATENALSMSLSVSLSDPNTGLLGGVCDLANFFGIMISAPVIIAAFLYVLVAKIAMNKWIPFWQSPAALSASAAVWITASITAITIIHYFSVERFERRLADIHSSRSNDYEQNRVNALAQVYELFSASNFKLGIFWSVCALTGVVAKVTDNFCILYLVDGLGASVPQYIAEFALEGIVGCLISLPWCPLLPKVEAALSRPGALIVAVAAALVRVSIIVIFPTINGVIFSGIPYGLSWVFSYSLLSQIATELAPCPQLAATSVAVAFAFFYGVGGICGTLGNLFVQLYLGWQTVFILLTYIGVIATFLSIIYHLFHFSNNAILHLSGISIVTAGVTGFVLAKSYLVDSRLRFITIILTHLGSLCVALPTAWHVYQQYIGTVVANELDNELDNETISLVIKKSASTYDSRWDRIKFVLTQVVALNHMIDPLMDEQRAPALIYRNFTEFWLMQSYSFISGYLSVPVANDRRIRAIWIPLFTAYLFPQVYYLILIKSIAPICSPSTKQTMAYDVFIAFTKHRWDDIPGQFFYPYYQLWYMAVLPFWRLLAPVWMRLRAPLTLAVASSVIFIGYNKRGYPLLQENQFETFLSFQYVWAFWPCYVAGIVFHRYSDHRQMLDFLLQKKVKCAAMVILSILIIFNIMNIVRFSNCDSWRIHCKLNPNQQTYFQYFSIIGAESFYDFYGSSNKFVYYFLAYYSYLSNYLTHFITVIAVFSLLGDLDFGPFLDVVQMGKNSVVNYICHVNLIILMIFSGYYDNTTSVRFALFFFIAPVQSLFWMLPTVAHVMRNVLLAPFWFPFIMIPPAPSTSTRSTHLNTQHDDQRSSKPDVSVVSAEIGLGSTTPLLNLGAEQGYDGC